MSAPPIPVQRTATPRARPGRDQPPRFGEVFTDHIFALDHASGAWRDPRVVPLAPLALHPGAAVLHYAQAVFEGFKAVRGVDGRVRIFRLDRHCERLHASAERLCIPPPPPALVREAILTLVRTDRDWVPEGPGTALYLRPTVIATEPCLAVRPSREYLFFVVASPVGAYFAGDAVLRILVEEAHTRAAPGGLGGVKAAANYAAAMLPTEEARREGWTQVLWTERSTGAVQEVGNMNLLVRLDDEVVTPPLDGTILPGVTRASVLALLARAGHPVRERPITMAEIAAAARADRLREVFGSGTAAGVLSVGELGWRGQRITIGGGAPGPLARWLHEELRDLQSGAAPDVEGWMTEV